MTPTTEQLRQSHCLFSTDAVGGPEMTTFKREARWQQHLWARSQGIVEFGSHTGRRLSPADEPQMIKNGTKLVDQDAAAGRNFLSDAVRDAVQHRLVHPEKFQTLDVQRLRRDLLSSMPMAFNLFGEASMPENSISRERLAELFGVTPMEPSAIRFEWSPGRREKGYTGDRTAFDVALVLGAEAPQTVVGVETKYHEHSAKESSPKGKNAAAHQQQTDFLVDKAEKAEMFVNGWREDVLATDLRQIWRDHVLSLAMRADADNWAPATKYVLLYPSANVSFRNAAERYARLLVAGDDSFLPLTIEQVVDAAFAHGGPTKDRFRQRYLAWMS